MKKVIASVLSLMLVLALSVSVFATGGFVKSPTLDKAPTVEDVTVETGTAPTVTVTPYDDRHDLATEDKADLEVAYNEIKAAADLTKVAADLTKVAADKKVEAKNLAISDLFDISHGPIYPNAKNNGEGLAPFPMRVHRCPAAPPFKAARYGTTYAASAPLAFSASAAKPDASCTAMSASTLRSRVMPAFIRPFMKRL